LPFSVRVNATFLSAVFKVEINFSLQPIIHTFENREVRK